MKMILTTTVAILIIGGTIGQTAQKNSPADAGDVIRANADKIMTDAYGANWNDIYIGCVTTNRAQSKAMTAAYESAIGYHKAR